MAHTPGPWYWEWSDRLRAHALVNAQGKVVMDDGLNCDWGESINYQGEDARLIAAAPELLEACKSAMHFMEINFAGGVASNALKAILRVAIRKAEEK